MIFVTALLLTYFSLTPCFKNRRRPPIKGDLPLLLYAILKLWIYYEKSPIGDALRQGRRASTTISSYFSHVKKYMEFSWAVFKTAFQEADQLFINNLKEETVRVRHSHTHTHTHTHTIKRKHT
jgi:hypothetical protein